uniref:Uncharacterized protein n=1 Tax=Alexandrium monilatum TaxID=311494 RepID=A0A7S4RRL2_9DINO
MVAAAGLDEALRGLQRNWEQLAIRGLSPDCFVGAAGEAAEGVDGAAPALAAASSSAASSSWRGISVLALSGVAASLPIGERLPARAASRAWWRASEYGPARDAWLKAMGNVGATSAATAAAGMGGVLAASYGRARFLASRAAAELFRGKPAEQGELAATNRVKAPEPAVAFCDGTAALLLDRASGVSSVPDVALAVYDMVSRVPIGSIALSGAKHGQTIQKPLAVASLQAAGSGSAFNAQACVAALERLVVVFSWQVMSSGAGEYGTFQLQMFGGRVDELRWGEGGKEVLRSAAFVGQGPNSPVAVLMEVTKAGPIVEVYTRDASGYGLREILPIAAGPAPQPGVTPPRGALHGNLAVWAVAGTRAVEFVPLPELMPSSLAAGGGSEGEAPGAGAGAGGGKGGAGAAFARARQAAKKTKLKLGSDGGAGLDMEATRWGYLVEDVSDDPGQPDLKAGVLIIAIAGQVLHGLEDEDVMNWRFGRSFGEGVELTYLPAEYASSVIAADKASGDAEPEEASAKPQAGPTKRLTQARMKVELPMKLEAWTVAAHREPPRLVALIDNRLHLSDLCEDRPLLKDVLSGVVRAPHKRPATRLAVLDGSAGDVLLAGIAKAVLIWRVPALIAPLVGSKPAQPELLAAVPMPGRCTFCSAASGLALGADAFGWLTAELSGAGEPGGNLDVWQWWSGRRKPLPPLPTAARGRSTAPAAAEGEGDVVAQTLTAAGSAVDAVAKAMRRGATRVPLPALGGSAKDQVGPLRSWATKLPDEDGEALYAAANEAEKTMAEGVRELRRWMRTEGGKAASILVAARADDAKAVSRWAEECRRSVIWPLQAAFEAEPSDHEDADEEEQPAAGPGGLRFPHLARAHAEAQARAAAASAPAAPAAASGGSTAPGGGAAASAPAGAGDRPMTARERAAAAAAARVATSG